VRYTGSGKANALKVDSMNGMVGEKKNEGWKRYLRYVGRRMVTVAKYSIVSSGVPLAFALSHWLDASIYSLINHISHTPSGYSLSVPTSCNTEQDYSPS